MQNVSVYKPGFHLHSKSTAQLLFTSYKTF